MEEQDKGKIDLGKILLPKKDGPSPASAQRVNAGELLAQEQKAGKEGPQNPTAPIVEPAAPAPEKKPVSPDAVSPIQTYQSDIESMVEKKNVSTISIAAAEADKPKDTPASQLPEFKSSSFAPLFTRTAMIVGGVILFALAAGTVSYLFLVPHTVPVVPNGSVTPFITVDETVGVTLAANATHPASMTALVNARTSAKISLGLIERIYVTTPTGNASNPTKEVTAAELLVHIAPFVPQSLLRTLNASYLFGVHSFDNNEPFLILRTDSYETAYAAMLLWENSMQNDLAPLFTRVPPAHINPGELPPIPATTTVSSAATTSTTTTQPVTTPVFVDRIVENKDARVIQTAEGDILLMWTFLDRNTLLITTNEYTLREIISRITRAPQTGLPQ